MKWISRPAFVLIAVLWVMVGVGALGFAIALVARRSVASREIAPPSAEQRGSPKTASPRARVTIAEALADSGSRRRRFGDVAITGRIAPLLSVARGRTVHRRTSRSRSIARH